MYLSSLIREAYEKDGIVVAYIYGAMGHGKTSYAFWTAYEVSGSWDKVLKYTFFDMNEAIETMWRHIDKGSRLKIMIFDDAGFWLNRLTWWREEKVKFMELFNLARTIAAGILFTTPSEEIPRQLMNKCNYRVNVRPLERGEVEASESAREVLEVAAKYKLEGGGVAVAKGYQLVMLPSFLKIVRKEYIDYYPLWYPIYERYMKVRMSHIKRRLRELREGMTKTREEIFEEAVELYKKTGDSRLVYQHLKKLVPQQTAHRWAFYKIPSIVKLEGSSNTKTETSPPRQQST
jgi:shikimate kinase